MNGKLTQISVLLIKVLLVCISVIIFVREAFKKKNDETYGKFHILGGEGGGQQGSIITFYFFFVPNVLETISRH